MISLPPSDAAERVWGENVSQVCRNVEGQPVTVVVAASFHQKRALGNLDA